MKNWIQSVLWLEKVPNVIGRIKGKYHLEELNFNLSQKQIKNTILRYPLISGYWNVKMS